MISCYIIIKCHSVKSFGMPSNFNKKHKTVSYCICTLHLCCTCCIYTLNHSKTYSLCGSLTVFLSQQDKHLLWT